MSSECQCLTGALFGLGPRCLGMLILLVILKISSAFLKHPQDDVRLLLRRDVWGLASTQHISSTSFSWAPLLSRHRTSSWLKTSVQFFEWGTARAHAHVHARVEASSTQDGTMQKHGVSLCPLSLLCVFLSDAHSVRSSIVQVRLS